jgi:polar amino acid transport system substrate-binding protein
VPPGNPKGLKTIAEAISAGVAIAVMRDLPEHQYLVKAGVPARLVRATPTPDLMLKALTAGEADCAAFPNLGLREIIAAEGLQLDVTAGFVLDSQKPLAAAYGFRPKDDMISAFSAELRKLHESGEWLRISEPFGFTKENVPPRDLTAERLCGA